MLKNIIYIKHNGTQATEIEIFATALMLNTHVYARLDHYVSRQLFENDGDRVKVIGNRIFIRHMLIETVTIVTRVEKEVG